MDKEEAMAIIGGIPDTAFKMLWLMYLKGTPITQTWLADQMKKDRGTIRKYIRRLHHSKLVERKTSHYWQVADDSLFKSLEQ